MNTHFSYSNSFRLEKSAVELPASAGGIPKQGIFSHTFNGISWSGIVVAMCLIFFILGIDSLQAKQASENLTLKYEDSTLDTLFLMLQNDPTDPEALLSAILKRLEKAGQGQSVWIFREVGEYYYKREELDSAENYFKKGIKISLESDLNFFSAFFYTRLGMIANTRANYQEALGMLYKAKDRVLETDSYELECDIYRTTGNIYWGMGNYEKALENYLYSLQTADDHDLTRQIASATNNIGNVYQAIHDYQNARKYFEKAYELSRNNDFKWIAAISSNNIGDLFKEQNNYDSAIYYFTLSYNILDELDSKFYKGVILYNIGEIYLQMDSLEYARKYLSESQELADQSGDKLGLVSCYLKMGQSYLQENKPEKAINYLDSGLSKAYETGSYSLMELAHSLKVKYYRSMGQIDSAMHNMEQQLQLRDSLSRQESGESIARLESRFTEEKNRLEMDTLIREKLNARRLFYVILGSVAVILIVIFIFLFHARKKSRILVEKNKEIIYQQELLKTRNEELMQSQEELRKINEAKDQFLTILSHDLKNPISAIRGFIELMINNFGAFSDEKKKMFLQEIFDSVEKVSLLLTNVLFWVRSQTKGIKNYPDHFNLSKRIDTNLSLYKLIAQDKGIQLQNQADPEIEIFADLNLFDTILRNLVSNSLKFTGRGGRINVATQTSQKGVTLIVSDNGVGMSKEKLEKVLQPSNNFTTSGTNKEPGTGLGLQLVRDFTNLFNGHFHIISAPGQGSEFHVFFPVEEKK